jgi:hypothetical protein
MNINELYTAVNTKRRNAGLPKISPEKWVEEMTVLEIKGKVEKDTAGNYRVREIVGDSK